MEVDSRDTNGDRFRDEGSLVDGTRLKRQETESFDSVDPALRDSLVLDEDPHAGQQGST